MIEQETYVEKGHVGLMNRLLELDVTAEEAVQVSGHLEANQTIEKQETMFILFSDLVFIPPEHRAEKMKYIYYQYGLREALKSIDSLKDDETRRQVINGLAGAEVAFQK